MTKACLLCQNGKDVLSQRPSGAEDDAVVVGSNSDEEVDMDSDAVMVSMPIQSMRLPPSDAGFTDFDDFGGFQASDSPPSRDNEKFQSAAEVAKPDSQQWNAFSDPTDAGRVNTRLTGLLRTQ